MEQQRINRLVQQNIPEEYARRLLKVDELEWKDSTEKAGERQKMFTEFFRGISRFKTQRNEEIPQKFGVQKNPRVGTMLTHTHRK